MRAFQLDIPDHKKYNNRNNGVSIMRMPLFVYNRRNESSKGAKYE
jgi:hypothetical protein